jgi:hypothetical protein
VSDFFFIPAAANQVTVKKSTIVFVMDPTSEVLITDQIPPSIPNDPGVDDTDQRVICVMRGEDDERNAVKVLFNVFPTVEQIRALMVYLQHWTP